MENNRHTFYTHKGAALGALCVVLVIVLGVFSLLLDVRCFEKTLFSLVPPLGTVDREIVSSALHDYFNHEEALPAEIFTERERLHLADVRVLIQWVRALFAISVVILVVTAYRGLLSAGAIKKAATAAGFSMLAFGIVAVAAFEKIFLLFHEIIFSNDLWLLDPSVHALIRAYPPQFFTWFFIVWMALSILLLFTCAICLRSRGRGIL